MAIKYANMFCYKRKTKINLFPTSSKYFFLMVGLHVSLVLSIANVDTQLTDMTDCFHELSTSDGELKSPNYPGVYPDDIICIWLINAEHGKKIKLIFADFELEDSPGCTHDSLTIFDGNSTNSEPSGNFCGTIIQHQMFSSSNSMVIILNTNEFNKSRGFHAVYTTYSCGGVVSSANGVLQSPFFPHFFLSNTKCIWRIPVTPHQRVILNVTLFAVKTYKASCKGNYVRISSPDVVNSSHSHELSCGSIIRTPLAVQSEGSELRVEYSSSNLFESVFAAKYDIVQDDCSLNISKCEQLCEKIVDGYSCSCRDGYKLNNDGRGCSFVNASYSIRSSGFGEIISAGFPLKYSAYHRCRWKITGDIDEQILLKFDDFEMEYSPGCRYDAVEISEENNNVSTTLGIYCGNTLPMPISSSQNNIVIFFRTDGSLEKKGFKITYMSSKSCGGMIAVNNHFNKRIISSPFYPGAYPDNIHCVWEITAQPLHVIVLNFTAFHLHSIPVQEEKYDVLMFSNNTDNGSYEEITGYHLPFQILSDDNHLHVKFISHKPKGQERGFSAEVYSEENECLINNGGCKHVCNKEVGSYRCTCAKGYILKNDSDTCVVDDCQYELYSSYGDIRTPDFRYVCPINNTCHWLITTDEDKALLLNFTMLSSALCENDNLKLYFGNNTSANTSVNMCHENSLVEITSPDNQVYLVYVRRNQTITTKFVASFRTVTKDCAVNNGGCQHTCKDNLEGHECTCHFGYLLNVDKHNCTQGNCSHTITAPTGVLSSPNYPNHYPDGIECFWILKTTNAQRFNLTFTNFEVESHSECIYDRVNIFDGDSEYSPRLGHFCGSQVPSPIFSTGNRLYVTFKSDPYMSFNGFSAIYTSVCGGNIFVENELRLFSHMAFGIEEYASNTKCNWKLIAGAHKHIVIRFYVVDTENEANCSYDYVAVYEDGSLITKLCGSDDDDDDDELTSFSSKSNVIEVEFASDSSTNGRGFAATVLSV